MPGQSRFDDQGDFGGRLAHALGDLLLQSRIQGDGAQTAVRRLIVAGDLCAEGAAGMFGKFVGVLGESPRSRSPFPECPAEIADGNALGQQVLQNALHLADIQLRGNQFGHHRRMGLLEIVEQVLDVLAAENFVAMAAHRFDRCVTSTDGASTTV